MLLKISSTASSSSSSAVFKHIINNILAVLFAMPFYKLLLFNEIDFVHITFATG